MDVSLSIGGIVEDWTLESVFIFDSGGGIMGVRGKALRRIIVVSLSLKGAFPSHATMVATTIIYNLSRALQEIYGCAVGNSETGMTITQNGQRTIISDLCFYLEEGTIDELVLYKEIKEIISSGKIVPSL